MLSIKDKQRNFFQRLKTIKETYSELSLVYLSNDNYKLLDINTIEKQEIFKQLQLEILGETIYRVMELIDGYDDGLKYEIDIIDKETKQSLRDGIQFHDAFMNYIYENEEDDI